MSRLIDERRTPRGPLDHQRVEVLVEFLARCAIDGSDATRYTKAR